MGFQHCALYVYSCWLYCKILVLSDEKNQFGQQPADVMTSHGVELKLCLSTVYNTKRSRVILTINRSSFLKLKLIPISEY